jgi:ABC-type polysaccharide/polyol phosphate export permease
MSEIIQSFIAVHQWWTLAVFDVRQRYRRSTLGPLWITMSTGIMVLALGVLWSTLFKVSLAEFMPYFSCGLVIWGFISSQINEACTAYTQHEGYIKQVNLPFPIYILRICSRNIIVFAHNLIIFIVVWAAFGFAWMPNIPMFILGFIVIALILVFISIPIALLCTRFRDISPIIGSIMQIMYFFTPLMWKADLLEGRGYQWILDYNPMHHLVEILRSPMLGEVAHIDSWFWSLGLLIFFALLASFMHTRYRKRVAYWL